MPVPTVELVLPSASEPEDVTRMLGTDFVVVMNEATTLDRVLFESFDGRLRRAGLTLEGAADRAAAADWSLTLREAGRPAAHLAVKTPRPDRLLATDLPVGTARDRLLAALEERAALPIARVVSRLSALAVVNEDVKTVVRLRLERPEIRDRGASVRLAPRLVVTAVRGYDEDFERVRRALAKTRGAKEADRTLAEEVVGVLEAPTAPGKLRVGLDARMRTDRAAQMVCRRLAEHVEANLPGTVDDLDPEFLHDLRVGVRRSRSVLREFKHAFPRPDYERAREGLKWIQQVTGPTRDLDVALLEWDEVIAPLPADTRADLGPLHELLTRHRAKAFRAMRKELESQAFREHWGQWTALLARSLHKEPQADRADAARPIGEVAGERIRDVYRRMRREGGAIRDDSPPEALHDLRKRGKELRYLLELFGGLYDGEAERPLVRALKQLQDTLGRFQDRQVQAEFLRGLGPELARGRGGPDALIALGLVIEGLAGDQRDARAEFDERFAAFAGKETRRVVNTAFEGPA